jgi:hypothetical protein
MRDLLLDVAGLQSAISHLRHHPVELRLRGLASTSPDGRQKQA